MKPGDELIDAQAIDVIIGATLQLSTISLSASRQLLGLALPEPRLSVSAGAVLFRWALPRLTLAWPELNTATSAATTQRECCGDLLTRIGIERDRGVMKASCYSCIDLHRVT